MNRTLNHEVHEAHEEWNNHSFPELLRALRVLCGKSGKTK